MLSMSVWVSLSAPGSPSIKKSKEQVSPQCRQRQSCSNSGLILHLTVKFYCIMIKKSFLNNLNINVSAITVEESLTSQAILVYNVCVYCMYVCISVFTIHICECVKMFVFCDLK